MDLTIRHFVVGSVAVAVLVAQGAMRCPMIPGINDDEVELAALGKLADELDRVEALDVLPYVPYGIGKAHRLGLKVYEAPQPPPEYGKEMVAKISGFTGKPVRLP